MPRDRFIAALEMREVDCIPFWPKLTDAYLYSHQNSLPAGVTSKFDCYKYIGCEVNWWSNEIVRTINSTCSMRILSDAKSQQVVYTTPNGTATMEKVFHAASQSWHPVTYPLKTREDLQLLRDYFDDTYFEVSPEEKEKEYQAKKMVGSLGILARQVEESPLMQFVEWWAGVANAHLMLYDYEDDVVELFRSAHEYTTRKLEATFAHSCCDLFYMVENTSTSLISPSQFLEYNIDHLHEYAATAKQFGKRLALHMCGLLKDLLPMIASIDVVANEAFTSPPVGNTRLKDGRAVMPERCLIGGTNAVLWQSPFEEIVAELKCDLDALPHHRGIIITSGGALPPDVPIEKLKAVCDWVHAYPARF